MRGEEAAPASPREGGNEVVAAGAGSVARTTTPVSPSVLFVVCGETCVLLGVENCSRHFSFFVLKLVLLVQH